MNGQITKRGSSSKIPKTVLDFVSITPVDESPGSTVGQSTDVVYDVVAKNRENSRRIISGTGGNTVYDFDVNFKTLGTSSLQIQWNAPENDAPPSFLIYLSTTSDFSFGTWCNFSVTRPQGTASDDATGGTDGWNQIILDLTNPNQVSGNFDISENNEIIKVRITQTSQGDTFYLDRLIALYDFQPRICVMTDDGSENLYVDLSSQAITNISATNPAVITINNHGNNSNAILTFSGTGVNDIDGRTLPISNVTTNTFEIDADGTGWVSGGVAVQNFRNSKNYFNIPVTHSVIPTNFGNPGVLTELQFLDLLSDGDNAVNHNIYSESNINDFAVDPYNPTPAELAAMIAEPLEGAAYLENIRDTQYSDQIFPFIFVYPEGVAIRSVHTQLFKDNGFSNCRTIAGVLANVANNVNFDGIAEPYFIRSRGPAQSNGFLGQAMIDYVTNVLNENQGLVIVYFHNPIQNGTTYSTNNDIEQQEVDLFFNHIRTLEEQNSVVLDFLGNAISDFESLAKTYRNGKTPALTWDITYEATERK